MDFWDLYQSVKVMDVIKEFFKRDRFSNLVGIELLEVKQGYACAKLKIEPHHLNGFRVVQGGVLFTLADVVCAAASNSEGELAVSISASIHYIKSGREGTTLFAEGKRTCANTKLSSYDIVISNDNDEKLASFQGLVYHKKTTLEEVIRLHPD